jgi:hypothetical protein
MSMRHLLLLAVTAAACSPSIDAPRIDSPRKPSPAPPVVASIALTPIPDLAVGDSARASATPKDSAGASLVGQDVTWTSSDPGIATVDAAGLVWALSPGTATIIATNGGVTARESAKVYEPVVSSIVVTPATDTLFTEHHVGLFVTARNQFGRLFSASYPTKWTSSDPTVATVDTTGRVTAVAPGSTSITATVNGTSGASVITVFLAPPTVNVAGDWTLTMSPSPSCRGQFPAVAQTRAYTIHFVQDGADLRLIVSSPTVPSSYTFSGAVRGADIQLVFPGDTQYDGWAVGDFYDRLSNTEWLNTWGGVTGTISISGSEIHATMDGEINYWGPGSNIATGPTVVCNAKDHVLTLQR